MFCSFPLNYWDLYMDPKKILQLIYEECCLFTKPTTSIKESETNIKIKIHLLLTICSCLFNRERYFIWGTLKFKY